MVFESLFGFTLSGALLEILALVLQFLSGTNAYLHLHQGAFEVNLQRNDCLAARLDLGLETIQFASTEKKFSGATRFMIFKPTELVFAEVRIEQKKFVFDELGESLGDLYFAAASGLDLGSLEDNAGLVLIGYEVLAASLRVTDLPHPPRVFGFLGHSIGGSLVGVVEEGRRSLILRLPRQARK